MALELENSVAAVKHINARKEGAQDDKELAVDIKLEIDEVAVAVLPQFDSALRSFVFDKDTVRFPAVDMQYIKPTDEMLKAREVTP